MFKRTGAQRIYQSLVIAVLGAGTTFIAAQSAYRCDVNGSVVYSDKPCADGKAIAPTQDTREQADRADAAAKQRRNDERDLNRRIETRAKEDAKERSEIRKLNASAEKRAAAEAAKEKKAAKKKAKTSSVKKLAKAPKPKAAKKKDNRGSAPA